MKSMIKQRTSILLGIYSKEIQMAVFKAAEKELNKQLTKWAKKHFKRKEI